MRHALLTTLDHLRDAVPPARRAGFAGLSLRCPDDPRALPATARREVRAVIARHDLAPAALVHDLPGRGLHATADADRIIDGLRAAVELARDGGFPVVACDLGTLPRSSEPPRRKPVDPAAAGLILLPTAADVERVADAPPLSQIERAHAALVADVLREIGRFVDRVGVPIAFGGSLASTADLAAAVRSADCPLFFRDLDPAAVADEAADDAESVVKIEPPALHVRVGDAVRVGGRVKSAAVGEGEVPWDDLTTALRDADFAGWLTHPTRGSLGRIP